MLFKRFPTKIADRFTFVEGASIAFAKKAVVTVTTASVLINPKFALAQTTADEPAGSLQTHVQLHNESENESVAKTLELLEPYVDTNAKVLDYEQAKINPQVDQTPTIKLLSCKRPRLNRL